MKKTMLLAAALLAAPADGAAAQGTISPGMTAEQVRASFGAPATTRAAGEWTYWYYHNGCPNRCGSDDVVFFRDQRVVAAVLRTPRRRFAGPGASDALERHDDAPPPSAGARPVEAPVNL
ncbi:MAG TPA: outer membrane protein assembly factor BamE, partial [Longimicrobium sp.]|nr:outer membrane protein assembly factor BamE [Longimicrobium sp.]